MLTVLSEINFLAIIAAGVASFVLGGVWFGGVISKLYPIALGREALPPQKPTALFIAGPFFCNLVITITSAVLIHKLNISTVDTALLFGAVIGFGYLIPMCMTIAINPNFPRPFMYTLINAPYFILSSLMGSAIIVLMS